eukprot:Nk52_evm1s2074 gene=Nk52_evmTU1s2074
MGPQGFEHEYSNITPEVEIIETARWIIFDRALACKATEVRKILTGTNKRLIRWKVVQEGKDIARLDIQTASAPSQPHRQLQR